MRYVKEQGTYNYGPSLPIPVKQEPLSTKEQTISEEVEKLKISSEHKK